jgi:hypothetical protein
MSSKGCDCHGKANDNTKITASVEDGIKFEPFEKKTITINVSNPKMGGAGLNAAVKTHAEEGIDAGFLKAGNSTKVRRDEITHSNVKKFSGNSADFTFEWTAPEEVGEYYLFAAGVAANMDNGTSGDSFNWMDCVTLIVKGINLYSLDDGDKLKLGSNTKIEWEEFGVDSVRIDISSDGGKTYDINLADNLSGHSWDWKISSSYKKDKEYKIKITDTESKNIASVRKIKFK